MSKLTGLSEGKLLILSQSWQIPDAVDDGHVPIYFQLGLFTFTSHQLSVNVSLSIPKTIVKFPI